MDDEEEEEPLEDLEPFGPWEDGKVLAETADIAKQTVENFARVGLQFAVPEGDASYEGLDAKAQQEKAARDLTERIVGFKDLDDLKKLVLALEEEIFKVADPPTREPNKPMPDFDDENEDLPGACCFVMAGGSQRGRDSASGSPFVRLRIFRSRSHVALFPARAEPPKCVSRDTLEALCFKYTGRDVSRQKLAKRKIAAMLPEGVLEEAVRRATGGTMSLATARGGSRGGDRGGDGGGGGGGGGGGDGGDGEGGEGGEGEDGRGIPVPAPDAPPPDQMMDWMEPNTQEMPARRPGRHRAPSHWSRDPPSDPSPRGTRNSPHVGWHGPPLLPPRRRAGGSSGRRSATASSGATAWRPSRAPAASATSSPSSRTSPRRCTRRCSPPATAASSAPSSVSGSRFPAFVGVESMCSL